MHVHVEAVHRLGLYDRPLGNRREPALGHHRRLQRGAARRKGERARTGKVPERSLKNHSRVQSKLHERVEFGALTNTT